jgi:hypothetical protein
MKLVPIVPPPHEKVRHVRSGVLTGTMPEHSLVSGRSGRPSSQRTGRPRHTQHAKRDAETTMAQCGGALCIAVTFYRRSCRAIDSLLITAFREGNGLTAAQYAASANSLGARPCHCCNGANRRLLFSGMTGIHQREEDPTGVPEQASVALGGTSYVEDTPASVITSQGHGQTPDPRCRTLGSAA